MNVSIDDLKFDDQGLVPAIVQDRETHQVLTLAYVNRESLKLTVDSGQTWFWSRSRKQLWHKGETSGNTQEVVDIDVDCDRDAIVVIVNPIGPACHTGEVTCFHNALTEFEELDKVPRQSRPATSDLDVTLDDLYQLILERQRERPKGSYTAYLFNEGLDKILKKIGEEAAETIVAAKNDDKELFVGEAADLLYHLLVLLVERGVGLHAVRTELTRREKH